MTQLRQDAPPLYALTVLVPRVDDAQRLAAALDEARRPDGPLAVIAVPPVRGLAFFADAGGQDKLDRWWAHAIPAVCTPVSLLLHEESVPGWLPGLDGLFIVGVPDAATAGAYAGLPNVTVAGGPALVDLALAALSRLAPEGAFRDDAADRLERRLRARSESPARFRRARLRPGDEAAPRAGAREHPIPNLPTPEGMARLADDAHREELVRALADTLRRLQRIRGRR